MLVLKIYRNLKKLNAGDVIDQRSKTYAKIDRNKILLVGMFDSPHFDKWLTATRIEFPTKRILVFPSDRPRIKHYQNNKENKVNNNLKPFRLFPSKKLNFTFYYMLDTLFGLNWRAYFLAKFIIRHKPAIIHFHEMQHGAYIFNLIVNHRKIPNNSHNIISTWGSDLTLYSWVKCHESNIKSSLSWANVLTAEKVLEIEDALRLGFRGEFKAPVYVTIGANLEKGLNLKKPSTRKLILLKGHQSNSGRALNVLNAFERMAKELSGFEILVYSAPESVQIQVEHLRNKLNLDIKTIERIPNATLKDLFQQARLSISIAASDGLPGVLVEAMQAGAFPIQSSNSAGKDFIVQGENGFLVDPWNIESIKDSIIRAINDNSLVDKASDLNREILQEKYALKDGTQKLRELYL